MPMAITMTINLTSSPKTVESTYDKVGELYRKLTPLVIVIGCYWHCASS